jgi:hypothetical protein
VRTHQVLNDRLFAKNWDVGVAAAVARQVNR